MPMPSNLADEREKPSSNVWHVYPKGDTHTHDLVGYLCPCHPQVHNYHGKTIIIHNTLDPVWTPEIPPQ